MVDFDWKAKMVPPEKSPKLSIQIQPPLPLPLPLPRISPFISGELSSPKTTSFSSAYEQYLRLPELRKLWSAREFPNWRNESILKPALQALEITFRFVSTVLLDPRPYANRREWTRRLESLTTSQVQVIAALCEDEEDDCETRGAAPIVDLRSSDGVLARDGSLTEVWKLPGENNSVASRTSEASLLPRLATWQKSEGVARRILYSIECEMQRCPYTLGLGEPNLAGKPSLDYDAVCRPKELDSVKRTIADHIDNHENQTIYTTHQILESWIHTSHELLTRIASRVDNKQFDKAASDCWLLERIWKLLAEIEDLNLLLDPDDFIRLKHQLLIKTCSESEPICFGSSGLVEITRASKDLKHKVPRVLGVEVDPRGGPRIQEAAMRLYRERGSVEKIHLLQAMQAVEAAVKRFFFAYKQVLVMVFGSLDSGGDGLAHIYLEPTYFPSLDAAKTFLGASQ